MHNLVIRAASKVSGEDVRTARPGKRFGRMDLMSQLALLAVDWLGIDFNGLPRERIAICLGTKTGSLSTDLEYWKGRDVAGGPSPTLFTYTLPSAAIGEIAIRYGLRGPNLCLVGGEAALLEEAGEMIGRGEAEGCVCVYCESVSAAAAEMIHAPVAAQACGIFLARGGEGGVLLAENDRDMASLCIKLAGKMGKRREACKSPRTN
jgi:3-oxoacyl-(acyl-carrier-protein) synthase